MGEHRHRGCTLPFITVDPILKEVQQAFSMILVVDTATGREVQERWVTANLILLADECTIGACAVYTRDIDVFLILVVECIPDGLELLAVRAPRRVELDEPGEEFALLCVHDLVEVMDIKLLRFVRRHARQVFGVAKDGNYSQSK